jgi:two-component system OmpR family response regulator
VIASAKESDWLLVIDDDEDIRDSIQSLLQLKGYRVVAAADGKEGLCRMREGKPPRLVILDLMMPGMSGEEFRAAQLRDAAVANVPVIVFSGAGRLGDRPSLAGTHIVAKPIKLDELFAIVEKLW